MLPRTFFFMILCAFVGYLLGRTRGMGLQGFFMGLAFGPLGWGLILLWPTRWVQGPIPRDAAPGDPGPETGPAFRASGRPPESDRTSRARPQADDPACPRCRGSVAAEAGACPHCGNVLVPVRYRVNPG